MYKNRSYKGFIEREETLQFIRGRTEGEQRENRGREGERERERERVCN